MRYFIFTTNKGSSGSDLKDDSQLYFMSEFELWDSYWGEYAKEIHKENPLDFDLSIGSVLELATEVGDGGYPGEWKELKTIDNKIIEA